MAEIMSHGEAIAEAQETNKKVYYTRIKNGVSSEELLKLNKERRDFLKSSELELQNAIKEHYK